MPSFDYIIKEHNPSTDNFKVATVDCIYVFQLLQSNHHETVEQKCNNEIILHTDCERDLNLTWFILYIYIYIYICYS